jgi:hypothetical protein
MISKIALKAQYVSDSLYLLNYNPQAITITHYVDIDSNIITINPFIIDKYDPIKGIKVIAVNIKTNI